MNRAQIFAPLLAISIVATASSAHSRAALSEEPHINHSLVSVAVGDIIRKNCASITPRYFRVMRKGNELEDYVRGLGYEEAEVKAFLKDPAEKKRVLDAAWAYLSANGVVKGDEESYCALGRAEIERNTLTGYLLHSSK